MREDEEGGALWRLSACEVVALLKEGGVTPLELIEVAAARLAAVEPAVNAVPQLCLERARAAASALQARGHPAAPPPGYLYGLPVVVKDLSAVAGVRWTSGSLVHARRVAAETAREVTCLEAMGAIVLGKSNTPEFGAGSQTFNGVYGATRNPFDTRLTAGGSSGGAAAALASGGAWLATGSDLGGSLRIPASFCGVVGLRPSPGLVPRDGCGDGGAGAGGAGEEEPIDLHAVNGPMGRSAQDVALLLDAFCHSPAAAPDDDGPSGGGGGGGGGGGVAGWPSELAAPVGDESFGAAVSAARGLAASLRAGGGGGPVAGAAVAAASLPRRIAWSADLGGVCHADPATAAACHAAALWFGGGDGGGSAVVAPPAAFAYAAAAPGATLAEGACPDLSRCADVFRALRSASFARSFEPAWVAQHRALLKPEVVWNAEDGRRAGPAVPREVAALHAALLRSTAEFFERFDLLLCPCVPTQPFDVRIRYLSRLPPPRACGGEGGEEGEEEDGGGEAMQNYTEWLRNTYAVTLTHCPAVCIPVGVAGGGAGVPGLPVGLQMVGPPRSEAMLLATAAIFAAAHEERLHSAEARVPRDPAEGTAPMPVAHGPRSAQEAAAHHALPGTW